MGLSVLLLQIYPLGLSLCYSLAGLLFPSYLLLTDTQNSSFQVSV